MKIIYFFLAILLLGTFFTKDAQAISFDQTFGSGGQVVTSFGNEAGAGKVALQSDGKIVVVGSASNGSIYGWAIARYNTDGTLDTTFGTNGIVTKYFAANSGLNGVGIQSTGKIIVGGHSNSGAPCNSTNTCWTLARYNTDGTLDTSFGNNGIVVTVFINPNLGPQVLQSLMVDSNDKILAVGSTANVGFVRYNADGTVDLIRDIVIPPDDNCPPTFSSQPCGNTADGANAVRIQQDGKIVIVGGWNQYGVFVTHSFVLRLTSDVDFDSSFDSDGLSRPSIGARDFPDDVAFQPDGGIVLAGGVCITQNCPGGFDTFVARLTSSGVLDNNFGDGGKVITSFDNGNDIATATLLQNDGKILITGQQGQNSVLHRYTTNGSMDTSKFS